MINETYCRMDYITNGNGVVVVNCSDKQCTCECLEDDNAPICPAYCSDVIIWVDNDYEFSRYKEAFGC